MENIRIVNIEIEAGKAVIEIALPEFSDMDQNAFWNIRLWDEKDLPVFHCCRHIGEEEPCIIHLLHPKLWEGSEASHLYRLELYFVDSNSEMQLFERRSIAIYSLKNIPPKGWFLNGRKFEVKGVYYDCECNIFDAIHQGCEDSLNARLDQLVRMGANMLVLGTTEGFTGQEHIHLRECCERKGLILQTGDKDDNYVTISSLFHNHYFPTKDYYRYKAQWSRESFVYICDESFIRQPDGSYSITVYSNRKKIVLLVNGTVFAFREEGPEFCFQDIPIKGFPAWLSAEADECGMSVIFIDSSLRKG